MKCRGLHLLLPILCVVVGVMSCALPRRSSAYPQYERYPDYTLTDSIDREAFKSYLDTAAVDDWEGVWLLVGPGVHRYLMVERITTNMHSTYYTHRVRLWEGEFVDGLVTYSAGMVVGYMGMALYADEMNLELLPGTLFAGESISVPIDLDLSRQYITFILRGSRYTGLIGMRRIYPIRSAFEDSSKVRSL